MEGQSFRTKAVHSGLMEGRQFKTKATPIYQTSVFSFNSLEELEGYFEGDTPYLYTRNGNPNSDELAKGVAALESAPDGVAASSGLGAILAGILAVAQSGHHIVAASDLYGGTYHLIKEELKAFGITASFVDFSDGRAIEAAIQPNTKLLYTETITNPFLRVENVDALVETAKKHELYTMVDNTFATPYLLQPYTKGIDLVVHSATKYIGGHSDITAGVVAGRKELIAAARSRIVNMGMNLSPFESWLAYRGLKTLAIRMERQAKNAQELADFLRQHSQVKKMYYPEYVSEQGNGAVVTIELKEEINMSRFFSSLGWIKIVPSLAGVETTVSYPLGTSHRSLTEKEKHTLGINERVVRISTGIEESSDIIRQVEQAISSALLR
ncbi:aminotransferase class I/II-fold pyridoxal phosphate-dependent enzyme [Bacillus aerolatus]|uniref:homocysteine desulfhydrase n=1 Tax=Bacillus aerolatus TaxID=2653354 RepID=A0A6I1FQ39_9BACI|nr:PLP-dependent aspartate aminotransferase family protein [Bacillus aerolatus]KAB7706490.1 aminotransferase class I/II-fold pyridoxal phosphate-dependent enzyme [Bacillus aerolatus]